MKYTYIYIFFAVLALFLIVVIYKYLKPSLDQIKQKTIGSINDFVSYVSKGSDENVPKGADGQSYDYLLSALLRIIGGGMTGNTKKLVDNINKSTDKEQIYKMVTKYLEDIRLRKNKFDGKFKGEKNVEIVSKEVNKRIDDLLKKLKF